MITRNLINITDHPVLNVTRKAQVFRSSLEYDSNRIILRVKVYHYDENNNLMDYLKNDIAELISDNNTRVNRLTGEIVENPPIDPATGEFTEDTIGEFDYLWNLANVLKVKTIVELEEIYIGLRVDKINNKLYNL